MSANLRLSVIAVSVALLTMSGGAVDFSRLSDLDGHWILGAAAAESGGGHDSGSTSGGHDSGSTSGGHTGGAGGGPPAGKGGGHDSGSSGGGHDSGSSGSDHTSGGHESGGGGKGEGGKWGAEEKGHGLKKKHEGHAAGMHGEGGSTAHDMGARRFAGGAGVTSTNLVPEGLGRYGEGAPSNQGRTRYWGGWSLPEDVDPTTYTAVASSELVPAGGGGGSSVNVRGTLQSAARCDDVGGGTMTTSQRFSGQNLSRISAARALLDPATASAPVGEKPYLLASFQEELQKPTPDLALAGVYVGLIAKGQVTPAKVKSVGARLCVPVSNDQAEAIAQAAEQQRVAVK